MGFDSIVFVVLYVTSSPYITYRRGVFFLSICALKEKVKGIEATGRPKKERGSGMNKHTARWSMGRLRLVAHVHVSNFE